jgi:hypothetical protein
MDMLSDRLEQLQWEPVGTVPLQTIAVALPVQVLCSRESPSYRHAATCQDAMVHIDVVNFRNMMHDWNTALYYLHIK